MVLLGTIFSAKAEDSNHKFYTSLTEIEYNRGTHTFEISMRIFIDDLQLALKEFHGKAIDDNIEKHKEVISEYLKENFTVKVNDLSMPVNYLGGELEMDVLWVYMEIEDIPETITHIDITNKVLIEVFHDQINIVNYFGNKETKKAEGLFLHRRKSSGTIKL